jgi:hypothetical protein
VLVLSPRTQVKEVGEVDEPCHAMRVEPRQILLDDLGNFVAEVSGLLRIADSFKLHSVVEEGRLGENIFVDVKDLAVGARACLHVANLAGDAK